MILVTKENASEGRSSEASSVRTIWNEGTNVSNSISSVQMHQAKIIDPVQLHADAHNSVALAAYYLAKGSNKAAQRKLGQAMAAMRALDKVEG